MDGVLVRDKSAQMQSPTTWWGGAPPGRAAPGRARRHRPAGHRGAGLALGLGHPAAAVPAHRAQALPGRGRLRAETDTLDAAGNVTATAPADGGRGRLGVALAGFPSAPRSRSRRWSRPSRWPASACTPRPAGARRSSAPGRSWSTSWSCSASPPGSGSQARISVVCSGGTCPVPGRRPRSGPRHPGPPGQPAAHGRRPVHRGRGPHPAELAEPGRLEAAVLDPAAAMASTVTRALTPAEAAAWPPAGPRPDRPGRPGGRRRPRRAPGRRHPGQRRPGPPQGGAGMTWQYDGVGAVPDGLGPTVATVGMFDGVH